VRMTTLCCYDVAPNISLERTADSHALAATTAARERDRGLGW
jgi:hypothetical protein